MSDLLHAYWSGALRRLQAEVDGFAQLVKHRGEQGRENELALARMLTSLIPARFGTGSGLLIDSEERQSPQTDVIIYERAMDASLFAQANQVLFPIEACYATVEVKTTLSAEDVADFGVQQARAQELLGKRGHRDESLTPVSCLFAYSAWARPQTVLKHLLDIDATCRPELFCIVDSGCVGGVGGRLGWDDPDEFKAGMTYLYEATEAGPARRPATTKERFETIGGSTYAVFREGKDAYYLIDAPRALVLFLEALLRATHSKADGRETILSLYMNEALRRVDIVTPPTPEELDEQMSEAEVGTAGG